MKEKSCVTSNQEEAIPLKYPLLRVCRE